MGLPILDVAIGLSFIFLLLSLVCTSVNELLAGVMNQRGKYLQLGIERLLGGDTDLKQRLYDHPLIKGSTAKGSKRLPAYISAKRFAMVLLDEISGPTGSRMKMEDVNRGIAELKNPELKTALKALMPETMTDPFHAHAVIEEWFNEGMDRVSGWYKRHSQIYIVALAAVVTLSLNADTLHVSRVLWVNPTLRAQFVDAASVRLEKDRPEEMLPLVEYPDPDDPTRSQAVDVGRAALSVAEQDLLTQVMGWDGKPAAASPLGWFAKIFGWLITIAALALGAPFWFDTLKRFMRIRNTGRSPVEARDQAA